MTEPFDSTDVDALEELERSHGYQLLQDRIGMALETIRHDLERPDIPEASSHYLRGQIAALRLVLRLSGVLKQEIRK